MNIIKETVKRMGSESPSFFKKIQAACITLGAIGTAIVTVPASIIILPPIVITIGGYCVVAGLVGAAIAKTPVSDPSVLKPEDKSADVTPPSTPK